MEKLSLTVLREKYLQFFESKGHLRLDSFPLVPENDNSLLLINAGMAPLKPYFTGALVPPRKRVTTCQKCVRTPDIENVGKTARHGTFFEMLGNFSFGDYFKEDAIPWAWEFLTKVLEIPADRLYITIYEDDDEAFEIWRKTGVPADRIYRKGKEDNFWEIGAGPCGPCSEISFDRGEKYGCGKPSCAFGCECDRYIEVWNIVFTQFDGDGKGNYTRLANPNIDTGMGLERLACIMQDVGNLFEVDTIRNIMFDLCKIAKVEYTGGLGNTDVSLRVITDHIRTATFLISDGVLPSNEGRGYVLRRVLRRAARHGRLLGIKGNFLEKLCETVIRENGSAYPNLVERREFIKKTIATEEERFSQTLDQGLGILEKIIADLKGKNMSVLPGDEAFKLYDTYGFPLDLTKEIAGERGLEVDEEGFASLMQEQRKKARDARAAAGDFGWTDDTLAIDKTKKTIFTGYNETATDAEILYIIKDGELQSVISGGEATLILDKTPFYAESGGQIGDTGTITTPNGVFTVTDTKKTPNGQYLHIGCVAEGAIQLGKTKAEIDVSRRGAIMRNHSSAHLLQAALKKVLGSHVEQAGSYVSDKVVRFDFTHYQAMTKEEIAEVERLVNEEILKGDVITATEMSIEDAKKTGAVALFGEKYGETVRVVKMGDFSAEFCGGTHLDNTAKVGLFKIISESSVAAGVRRIEGVTGLNSLNLIYENEKLIQETAKTIKATNINELVHKAESVINEVRAYKKALEAAQLSVATAKVKEGYANSVAVNGLNVVKVKFDDIPVEILRQALDNLLDAHPESVGVLATVTEGKVLFVAGCGKTALEKKANAGKLLSAISPIVGGGGGGRPDRASSGGKNPEKLDEAFIETDKVIKSQTEG